MKVVVAGMWIFNFLFTTISQIFLTFYVCFYISVSGWIKVAILNIAVISTIIIFARLFKIHLNVTDVTLNKQ